MKKTINGKPYDTDTAERIASYDNGYNSNNLAYCSETLHRKDTGEYFLHGEGGPMSEYGKYYDDQRTGGERIIPYTKEEAMAWAVENMDADAYMELFGPVAE